MSSPHAHNPGRRSRGCLCPGAAVIAGAARVPCVRRPLAGMSSPCERTELVLGGLRSAEPWLGEPWPPLTRSYWDGLRLGAACLAGRVAHRRADARECQARRLVPGGALLDQRAEARLELVGCRVR